MHEVKRSILKNIVDILDGKCIPEDVKFIKDCTFDLMASPVLENKVKLSFMDGTTTITSILATSYEIVENAIVFHGDHGEVARVVGTDSPHEYSTDRYFVTKDEVRYIHDMMIGEGGQYYTSPSGWEMTCDERGAVMCFNGIEFPIRHMDVKGRYIYFISDKDSTYDYILISTSTKCPF